MEATFEQLAAAHELAEQHRDHLLLMRAPRREIDAAYAEVGRLARECHDHLAEHAGDWPELEAVA